MANAVPSALLAISICLMIQGWRRSATPVGSPAFRPGSAITSVCLCLFVAGLALLGLTGRWLWLETLTGLSLVIAAHDWRPDMGWQLLARFGSLAFGIYLSHLLFIKTAEALARKWALPVSPVQDILIFAAACLGSLLLASALTRWRTTRWLVC